MNRTGLASRKMRKKIVLDHSMRLLMISNGAIDLSEKLTHFFLIDKFKLVKFFKFCFDFFSVSVFYYLRKECCVFPVACLLGLYSSLVFFVFVFVLHLKNNNNFFFGLFRATRTACANPQARGRIRAIAAGLHHSHSKARLKLFLRPTSQPMTKLDP